MSAGRVRLAGWASLCVLVCARCAHAAPPTRIALTIVRHAPPAIANRIEQGLDRASWPPVDVRWAELPSAAPISDVSHGEVELQIEQARKRYLSADFNECLTLLGNDELVAGLVARGHVALASRALLWRVACHVGANDRAAAERDARSFARYGFELPLDIDRVTPEVGRQLNDAKRFITRASTFELTVQSTKGRAWILVDTNPLKRPLPCKVVLTEGDHLIALQGDGLAPEWRTVHVGPHSVPVELDPVVATADIAAAQWTERYATQSDLDAASSLELLSIALSARKLAMFTAEQGTKRLRLRAALVVDGHLVAYAERLLHDERDVDAASSALLRELLETGGQLARAPPLVKRPLFWVGIAAAALVAAGVSVAIVLRPRVVAVTF